MKVQLMVVIEVLNHVRKKLVLILLEFKNIKACLNLHYNFDNSYLFGNEKWIFELRTDNKNVNFRT